MLVAAHGGNYQANEASSKRHLRILAAVEETLDKGLVRHANGNQQCLGVFVVLQVNIVCCA